MHTFAKDMDLIAETRKRVNSKLKGWRSKLNIRNANLITWGKKITEQLISN